MTISATNSKPNLCPGVLWRRPSKIATLNLAAYLGTMSRHPTPLWLPTHTILDEFRTCLRAGSSQGFLVVVEGGAELTLRAGVVPAASIGSFAPVPGSVPLLCLGRLD